MENKYIVIKKIWFMERGTYPWLHEIFKRREYRIKMLTFILLEFFCYIKEYEEPRNTTVAN